jgi:cytochrome c-type biogenesis protein CcmH
MMARARGLVAVLLLGWAFAAMAVDIESLPTAELQGRYDALTHELRCMQCQNQSLADSPVGLASDLRREVREMLIAGRSDQEIRDHLVQRYGNFILFRPPFEAGTAWVWIAPFVLLAVGVFVAFRIVRQRGRLVSGDDSIVDTDERA